MSICAEIEQEKGGRWVAKMPGVVGYGLTRHEAVVGLTVNALRILADRVESGQLEVEDEPVGIVLSEEGRRSDLDLSRILLGLLGLEGHTPNAETIAALEEYERNGGKSFNSIEELMAELNADD